MSNDGEMTANQQGFGCLAQFIGWSVIVVALIFSDVMFFVLLQDAFPSGFLRVGAILGAFTTTFSVLALCIGKSHWFRPGKQLIAAWLMTAIEAFVCIMNTITAVDAALNGKENLGVLSYWLLLAPATPVVAMLGWIVLLFLDQARERLHKRMEMQDKMSITNLQFELDTYNAQMELKRSYLLQHRDYLQQELASPEIQQAIKRGAAQMAADTLSSLIGQPVSPRQHNLSGLSGTNALPAGKVVDADKKPAPASVSTNKTDKLPEPSKPRFFQSPERENQPQAAARPVKQLPPLRKQGISALLNNVQNLVKGN